MVQQRGLFYCEHKIFLYICLVWTSRPVKDDLYSLPYRLRLCLPRAETLQCPTAWTMQIIIFMNVHGVSAM